jgi:hypothetical protein
MHWLSGLEGLGWPQWDWVQLWKEGGPAIWMWGQTGNEVFLQKSSGDFGGGGGGGPAKARPPVNHMWLLHCYWNVRPRQQQLSRLQKLWPLRSGRQAERKGQGHFWRWWKLIILIVTMASQTHHSACIKHVQWFFLCVCKSHPLLAGFFWGTVNE